MDKFEYKMMRGPQTIEILSALNSLGSEGWELVCICGDMYFFKRKKRIG